ncbi:nad(p)h-quinone oxidoreductase subunit t [Quercus suber]|uniref:Nad(P)h-quinone oxidoreductase subunit t n=1 Tax=Quercus suber TaxID=58331 RepID=A0AAW0IMV1_QUESU|nr:nad(p)h-quinone oxidoreductase subunit t, chloroplastic [Quercus suber]
MEEIRAAYRRLSKARAPSRHNFSLKAASGKFMKLREVYDVLSNEETRRFYDRTLSQEAASLEMRMKLEIPFEKDVPFLTWLIVLAAGTWS